MVLPRCFRGDFMVLSLAPMTFPLALMEVHDMLSSWYFHGAFVDMDGA